MNGRLGGHPQISGRRRWPALPILAAAALPAAIALLASGSCSLAQLYSGLVDASVDGTGPGGSHGGSGGGDAGPGDAASPCPAEMVGITSSADSGYCVDKLEVTNGAYAVFLAQADGGASPDPPGKCDWSTSHAPLVTLDGGDLLPVLGVDWCDAYAYCKWAGKRLCGAVGGGPVSPDRRDTLDGQWFSACSHKATRSYPYGADFEITDCADCNPAAGCDSDASPPTSAPAPVGTRKECAGGYTGLLDMSGNAAEWEDGCDDGGLRPDAADDAGKPIADPRYDTCYHRGGSFLLPHGAETGQACLGCASQFCPVAADLRSHHPRDVGLRCCLDY